MSSVKKQTNKQQQTAKPQNKQSHQCGTGGITDMKQEKKQKIAYNALCKHFCLSGCKVVTGKSVLAAVVRAVIKTSH